MYLFEVKYSHSFCPLLSNRYITP